MYWKKKYRLEHGHIVYCMLNYKKFYSLNFLIKKYKNFYTSKYVNTIIEVAKSRNSIYMP